MESSQARNDNARVLTPNLSPKSVEPRNMVSPSPPPSLHLPESILQNETPEPSPDRGGGGVPLPPTIAPLNFEISSNDGSPHVSPERGLQYEAESESIHSSEDAEPHPPNTPEWPSLMPGLRHRSLTKCGRLPPRKLPHSFFPGSPVRSASSPPHSPDDTTLDSTPFDGAPRAPSPTGEENDPPSTTQAIAEPNEYSQQEPPPYQPRPLNIQRKRRRDEIRRLVPSPDTQRSVYEWLRIVSLDLLFMFIFLGITGIILLWAPLWHGKERLFPMTYDPYSNTWYGPLELSYPHHELILGIATTGVMIPLIPLAVITLSQFWIRSWVDYHAAVFALKKAMVMMFVD